MNRTPMAVSAASILTVALAASLAVSLAVSSASASIYDEGVDGDLSNDRFAPTMIGLDVGLNTVTMDVIDSDGPGGDLDYFTFTLGADESIDSIVLLDASNPSVGFDSVAFVGLAFDSIFDFDPLTFSGDGLVGFTLTPAEVVGTDVLGDLSDGLGSLGEGDYSFWVQQTGEDLTRVSLGINVVPTPASTALLGLMGVAAIRRRR